MVVIIGGMNLSSFKGGEYGFIKTSRGASVFVTFHLGNASPPEEMMSRFITTVD
jgi:hypothetical protein